MTLCGGSLKRPSRRHLPPGLLMDATSPFSAPVRACSSSRCSADPSARLPIRARARMDAGRPRTARQRSSGGQAARDLQDRSGFWPPSAAHTGSARLRRLDLRRVTRRPDARVRPVRKSGGQRRLRRSTLWGRGSAQDSLECIHQPRRVDARWKGGSVLGPRRRRGLIRPCSECWPTALHPSRGSARFTRVLAGRRSLARGRVGSPESRSPAITSMSAFGSWISRLYEQPNAWTASRRFPTPRASTSPADSRGMVNAWLACPIAPVGRGGSPIVMAPAFIR